MCAPRTRKEALVYQTKLLGQNVLQETCCSNKSKLEGSDRGQRRSRSTNSTRRNGRRNSADAAERRVRKRKSKRKRKRGRAPRTRELVLRHAARAGIAARAGAGGGCGCVARGQRREPVLHDGHLDQVEAELLDPLHAQCAYVYRVRAMPQARNTSLPRNSDCTTVLVHLYRLCL